MLAALKLDDPDLLVATMTHHLGSERLLFDIGRAINHLIAFDGQKHLVKNNLGPFAFFQLLEPDHITIAGKILLATTFKNCVVHNYLLYAKNAACSNRVLLLLLGELSFYSLGCRSFCLLVQSSKNQKEESGSSPVTYLTFSFEA